jgi:hypothetical protein
MIIPKACPWVIEHRTGILSCDPFPRFPAFSSAVNRESWRLMMGVVLGNGETLVVVNLIKSGIGNVFSQDC